MLISVFLRYPTDTGKYYLQMQEEERRGEFPFIRFYERHFKDNVSLDLHNNPLGVGFTEDGI